MSTQPKLRIKILDFAAWINLINMMDEGNPGSERVSDRLMSGDFTGAWSSLKESGSYVFSPDGFKDLMNTAVKYGIAKFVVEATPLKRSFNMFGIEVGF